MISMNALMMQDCALAPFPKNFLRNLVYLQNLFILKYTLWLSIKSQLPTYGAAMGIFRTIGRGALAVGGRIFNVRADKWLSYDYLKGTFKQTSAIVRETFIPPPRGPKVTERFEDAIQRMQLSEADIRERYQSYLRLCIFYAVVFLGILSYTVYMACQAHFVAMLMSLCLSLWIASFCFRYHYWSFQIKHRKLGCTLKEWFDSEVTHTE